MKIQPSKTSGRTTGTAYVKPRNILMAKPKSGPTVNNESNRSNSIKYRAQVQAAAKTKRQTKLGAKNARWDWQSGDMPGAEFYSSNKDFIRGYNKAFAIIAKARKTKGK